MNNANENSKIVDLGQRQDPRNERVGDLMAAVRNVAAGNLQTLIGGMFENVDDALFDLAEKAENNAVQTQYFDGMREVRKKRAIIERVFLEQVARNLGDLAAGRGVTARPEPSQGAPTNTAELSLVDDAELEESLAITSMISKTESRLARPLFAVNQRLSVICGGNKLDNGANPLAPAQLGASFRQAMRDLVVEMRVKLIVYKLFDRYVMSGLDALYDAINSELMRAGVLPQLRHAMPNRRNPAAPTAGRGGAAPATAHGEVSSGGVEAEAMGDEDAEVRAELLQTLHGLLAARRGGGTGGGARGGRGGIGNMGASMGGGTSLSPAELLGALSLLQSDSGTDTGSGVDDGGDWDLDVDAVKQRLMQQISRLKGGQQARMSGADEDTIDLVGMLFEFIHQDRNLPAEMQALLSRLQIPYLKAAILDRRMFAHTQHPARRLLDTLAEVAKSWSPESDRDRRLYGKLEEVVAALLQDFDDDMGIFERLLGELQHFVDNHRRRAELSEQRLAEATRGREKLQEARRRAAREILERIDGRELPALAHSILTRAWANYMVLTLLRQGDDSQEFRVALRFVDDFVWSTGAMHGEGDRERLRKLLPLLEKSLRHGLATVAFQDADVESLMRRLNAFYREQLDEPVVAEEQAETPATGRSVDSVPPMPASVEAFVTPEAAAEADAVAEPAAEAEVDDEHLQRARALKVGAWVEFVDADGGSERAKLSWISPISGKYLFVNRRGLKVADKTLAQLGEELARGATVVLEELPLFDRALDAIVERLRRNATPAASAATDATPASDA